MRLPDPTRSRAVLIGTGLYTHLPEVPAVERNLTALTGALVEHTGLVRSNCSAVTNPVSLADFGAAIIDACSAADDLLLFYYAGHGLVDPAGELHLTLPGTSQASLPWTGVPFEFVRQSIRDAPAAAKIAILDCCFSGRATDLLNGFETAGPGALRIAGTFTLASSPANTPSLARAGETFTAFTGALLTVLAAGSATAGPLLTMHEVYLSLLRAARDRGLPVPQKCGTHTADMLALSRNYQYRAGGVPAGTVPAQVPLENQETTPVRRKRTNHPPATGTGMSPADVQQVTFRKPMLGRRGYAEDEVDAFLDEIERDLAQPDGTVPSLRPEDIRNVTFKAPSLGKRGYAEDEVDSFLEHVATELERRWKRARPDGA